MPSHANGNVLVNERIASAGIDGRLTPWKPSQPAMTSHSSVCATPVVRIANRRPRGVMSSTATSLASKMETLIGRERRDDQVLDYFVLSIDGDRPTAGELGHVDPMIAPTEAKKDAAMDQPFSAHALADADLFEQMRGIVLEHAGANALLAVRAAPRFDDDGLDSALRSMCARTRPDGPAPMMPTCVRSTMARSRRRARSLS